MNFICRCCKSRVVKNNFNDRFAFVPEAGLHRTAYHMEWVRFREGDESPIAEREWEYFDDTPEVGKTCIMRVQKPFDEELGGIFTNIFEPEMMAVNGWSDAEHPEDIHKAAAVLCRFVEVLWSDDFTAFIQVEVLNVVLLADLHRVFPVTVSDRPVELFGDAEEVWTEYEDEHWLLRDWNAQGDVGEQQYLYTDDEGVAHEVLTSWFDFHDDTYTLSNVVSRDNSCFIDGDPKRYVRFISERYGFGIGFTDEFHKERMNYAFVRRADGELSSAKISCSDWFRIEKDFIEPGADSAEKAQEFREKYIRKRI